MKFLLCSVSPQSIAGRLWSLGLLLVGLGTGARTHAVGAEVVVWGAPGLEIPASADYEVMVRREGRSWHPFTYHSFNRPYDKTLDREGLYMKQTFLALHANEYRPPSESRDTYAHSWTHFDFAGGPVEVEVKIKRAFPGLTLPLQSCAVLPSSLGIDCRIVSADTVRFTLAKPAKIALVPNQREALARLDKMENKQALEGYLNPLFLFARAPEPPPPAKDSPGTLVVRPGQRVQQEDFARARAIYFEPGVHDYSRIGSDPDHYILLQAGQTVYLPGDAYVYGNFRSKVARPISDMPRVYGRGTLSGGKQRWTDVPYVTTVIAHIRAEGIQIADPHNHIQHSTAPIQNVAVVGAWHGNTDGPTIEARQADPYEGWHLDDCFVMAADTNVKVGGQARARRCTLWQLSNAEPLWIRNPDRCVVENLAVLAYNIWPPAGAKARGQTVNLHSGQGPAKNCLVNGLTIEAPFLPLLFYLPTGATNGEATYENVMFANIVVRTRHIAAKSRVGTPDADPGRFGRIVFRNLVINGTRVTAANCRDYFELQPGLEVGRHLVFE